MWHCMWSLHLAGICQMENSISFNAAVLDRNSSRFLANAVAPPFLM